jgi:hypothetical protein
MLTQPQDGELYSDAIDLVTNDIRRLITAAGLDSHEPLVARVVDIVARGVQDGKLAGYGEEDEDLDGEPLGSFSMVDTYGQFHYSGGFKGVIMHCGSDDEGFFVIPPTSGPSVPRSPDDVGNSRN